jgi:hypothetical protein
LAAKSRPDRQRRRDHENMHGPDSVTERKKGGRRLQKSNGPPILKKGDCSTLVGRNHVALAAGENVLTAGTAD